LTGGAHTGDQGPRRGRRGRPKSGIVLFDKPVGSSSNSVLQQVKRAFDARKAGHTGSLDPLASGMLPICLGEATKVSAYLLGSDKEYRVRMALGRRTSTGDAEGPVVATGPDRLSRDELERALATCRGRGLQVPPMYSALKHQGRRLYELARAGMEVDRPARPVVIHRLEIEEFSESEPVLRVLCSKGTYIRTLVEDVARAAGTVAHVAELRRLAVAPFAEGSMVSGAQLERAASNGLEALDGLLLPMDDALASLPRVELDAEEATRLRHGQGVPHPDLAHPGAVRLYDPEGRFLGIGECLPGSRLVPRRLVAP
jgi:tRNA pseudouridine55 synthase